jgi:hypothetical protein
MKPFTVTWRLSSPLCLAPYPIHLDGLLAWAAVDLRRRSEFPGNYLEAKDDLPLEKVSGEDGATVWKASCLYGTPALEPELRLMIRRTDEFTFATWRGKLFDSRLSVITLGTGQFRNYSLRQAVQWFPELRAHGVGDIDLVKNLLGRLSFLGRLTRNGFGRIASFELVEDPEAATLWRRRNLPESLSEFATDGHAQGVGCISSPYWDRAAWTNILEWRKPVDFPAPANQGQSAVPT